MKFTMETQQKCNCCGGRTIHINDVCQYCADGMCSYCNEITEVKNFVCLLCKRNKVEKFNQLCIHCVNYLSK